MGQSRDQAELTLSPADVLALFLVAAVYVVAAKLGLRLAIVHASATPVWPPAGIALAALLLRGFRMWPAVLVGAFIANVTTAGSIATSLGVAAGNTGEAVVGAYLVTRFASGRRAFVRAQDVIRFVALAALLSTTISATIGVGSLVVGGFAPWERVGSIWFTWWLGDAAGDVLVTPFLLLWADGTTSRWKPGRILEAGLLVLSLVIVGQIVFGPVLPGRAHGYPIDFLAVPPLVWAAFRFGPRETATASLLLASLALWGTLHGWGPFAREDGNESLLLLQMFVGLGSALALAFAALVAEKKRVDEERLGLIPEAESARRLAEMSEKRARFLAEVSEVLSSSMERDATLVRITRMALPLLADFCTIDLVDEDGTVWCAASGHVNPAKESLAREARHGPAIGSAGPHGGPGVLRTRQPILVSEGSEGALAEAAISPEQLVTLRRLGLRSWMTVPMISSSRLLGAMTFGITESARRYLPVDLALAEAVAHRAANAIEKARLYQEARVARAEAETANRLKDEFLAMLGHELRNPLGAIGNAVHILDRVEDVRGRSATQARDIIKRQVQHLSGLIDDLLDMGRVMTGKIRLDRGPLDLYQAVERALNTLGAGGKTGHHVVRLHGESTWIHGDVTRIEQVVLNLLENALRYTPAGGTIDVHVHRHGERAVLRVEDSGMGIQPELLPRIFDLFVQGAREADRADGGLGIGLTLVKRLVELHDGTVQAESAGPGTGTTFVVSLPALSLSAAEEPRQLSAASPPSRRIVLVEDNADSRETLRVLFELYGHEVHEADDGPSGVETVLRVQPEAAFVDVGLPGFDGYEVARRIRSSPSGKGVYLVAVTGYGLASDKSRAREAGFDGHVVKPVNPAEVNALLRDLGSRGG